MKISKLFHWLYAFLMFLPVLALVPSLFYFAFNQQSQNYTDVQVNETYEYETNEVNSVDDLIEGNIYHLDTTNLVRNNRDYWIYIDLWHDTASEYINSSSSSNINNIPRIYINTSNADYQGNLTQYKYINENEGVSRGFGFLFNYLVGDFVYLGGQNLSYFDITTISASDYLGEKNVEVVRSEQSPMNIFYTAVNYVYDMPVFSWAKNSFLALPITYVTGLFGMASTNVVNYYLSYWLAISIVYLVFDLVMYVPLLVHRWIDKGMLE